MKNKKLILELMLTLVNSFVLLFPIQKNKVTLISLEGKNLKDDLLMIKNELPEEYQVTEVLYHFKKNDLLHSAGYLMNTIRQIWHINRSKLVLINDNNFVISKFKRPGVKVVQVWHANGAIKQFGNCLDRKYQIANYDYVLANSEYWKEPYSKAFGVQPEQIIVTGMPKLDRMLDVELQKHYRDEMVEKYPQCKNKKIVLYAPTFRGNIYEGIRLADINISSIMDELGDDYILLYKLHPLLSGSEISHHPNILDVTQEELYALFAISDTMISDYSSIIFDYSLLKKPIILYAPDLEEYIDTVGCFMEYNTLPGTVCRDERQLINAIQVSTVESDEHVVKQNNQYITHKDGKNTQRVLELIKSIMAK